MLIIATPKSASTSFVDTFAKSVGLEWFMGSQGEQREKLLKSPGSAEYAILASYHITDFKELDSESLSLYLSEDKIYKKHIAPTSNNISLLQDKKFVVLLRSPVDVIKAYRRAERRKIHTKKNEFSDCKSIRDWIKRSKEIGLYKELEDFNSKWRDSGLGMVLEFNEYVNQPKEYIKKAALYLGLNVLFSVSELSRQKYSRGLKSWIKYKLRR